MVRFKYFLAAVSVVLVIIVCVVKIRGRKVHGRFLSAAEVIKLTDLSYPAAKYYLVNDWNFTVTRDTLASGIPVSFYDKRAENIHEFIAKSEYRDSTVTTYTAHYDLALPQYADTFAKALVKLGFKKYAEQVGEKYSSSVYKMPPYRATIGKTAGENASVDIQKTEK